MGKYAKQIVLLSELESFDPAAFVGNNECPQELCDFVLALALAFNDFRDVVMAQTLLEEIAPADDKTLTPALGNVRGLFAHLSRLGAGILQELGNLIQRSGNVRAHPRFTALVKNLPAEAREAWKSLVAAVEKKPGHDELSMLLVRARNKVAFHYDAEEIGTGYRSAFVSKSDRSPLISRGASMTAARFYFADAAAEMYMMEVTGGETAKNFLEGSLPLFNQVNHALREIVTRFINARGYGFRS